MRISLKQPWWRRRPPVALLPAVGVGRTRAWGPWLLVAGILALGVFLGLLTAVGGGFIAVLLAIVIAAAVIGMFDFRICVIALLVIFPLTNTYLFPHKIAGLPGLNPFNVVLLLALASFIVSGLLTDGRWRDLVRDVRFFWPVLVALGIGFVVGSGSLTRIPNYFYLLSSELYATKGQYFRDTVAKPALIFVFIALVASGVRNSRSPQAWLAPLLLSMSALAAIVFIVVALSGVSLLSLAQANARSFLSPTGMHANEVGVILIPAFATCLYLIPSVKGAVRLAVGMLATAFLIATLLTFSRAAFLAVILVALIFSFQRKRFSWIFLSLTLVVVGILFAPEPVKERVVRGFNLSAIGSRDSSGDTLTAGRVGGIWKPLLADVKKNAIFGGGMDSTLWSRAAQRGEIFVGHPHNAYIRLIMDHGIVFGLLIIFFHYRCWRLWRAAARNQELAESLRSFFSGICTAYIAFLAQCMSGSTLVMGVEHAVYLGAIGIALGLQRYTAVSKREATLRPVAGGVQVAGRA